MKGPFKDEGNFALSRDVGKVLNQHLSVFIKEKDMEKISDILMEKALDILICQYILRLKTRW